MENYKSKMSKEEQEYIKEKIFEKYKEDFDALRLKNSGNLELLNLPEFMKIQHSEKYKPEDVTYENDERLQKVYAIVDKEKNSAYFVNTNEESKERDALPEGLIATQNLKNHVIMPTSKLYKKIRENMNIIYAGDPKKAELMARNFFHSNGKDLENLEKLVEQPENFSEKIKKICKQKNEREGISKEKTQEVQEEADSKKDKKEQKNEEEVKQSKLPKHIVKYCLMAGIAVPKAVIDTKAMEASAKLDEPRINKNGGNVTIIKVRDDSKQTDKYLVFQDDKLIIPGNRDDKIDKVVGRRMQHSKNGQLIKPLEIDDKEQFFEYSDSQGNQIKEQLNESTELSIDDLEAYKRDVKYELEKFANELNSINEDPKYLLKDNDAEKDRLRMEANERFNKNNLEIARKYNIDFENAKEINLATDQTTLNQNAEEHGENDKEDDEPEAWEVPGRLTH